MAVHQYDICDVLLKTQLSNFLVNNYLYTKAYHSYRFPTEEHQTTKHRTALCVPTSAKLLGPSTLQADFAKQKGQISLRTA